MQRCPMCQTCQETFKLSRALCAVVKDKAVPLLVELASTSPLHERFDRRLVHLVRVVQWPDYVQEAVAFPGRGVFARGRWENRTRSAWD